MSSLKMLTAFIVAAMSFACGPKNESVTAIELTFDKSVSAMHRELIVKAAKAWNGGCHLGLDVVVTDTAENFLNTIIVDSTNLPKPRLGQAQSEVDGNRNGVITMDAESDDDTYYFTALHELGHVFGLAHSKDGLMAPVISYKTDLKPYCAEVKYNLSEA